MFRCTIGNWVRAMVLASMASACGLAASQNASAQFNAIGAQGVFVPVAPVPAPGFYPVYNPYLQYNSGFNPYLRYPAYNPYAFNPYVYNRGFNPYAQYNAPFSPQRQLGRLLYANQFNNRNPNNVQYIRGANGNIQAQGGVVRFPGPNRRR